MWLESLAQLTGDVDGEDGIQQVLVELVVLAGRARGQVDQGALAEDADGVEEEEGVVAQPGEQARLVPGQGEGEVRVADDLGDGPGHEHGRVEGREGEEGEAVDDGPDEEEARRDLHDGGEQRGAHDA